MTRIIVTNYNYCNFFIILINDIVCIRIEPDKELFEKTSVRCKLFYEKTVLPYFLGNILKELTIPNPRRPGNHVCTWYTLYTVDCWRKIHRMLKSHQIRTNVIL